MKPIHQGKVLEQLLRSQVQILASVNILGTYQFCIARDEMIKHRNLIQKLKLRPIDNSDIECKTKIWYQFVE